MVLAVIHVNHILKCVRLPSDQYKNRYLSNIFFFCVDYAFFWVLIVMFCLLQFILFGKMNLWLWIIVVQLKFAEFVGWTLNGAIEKVAAVNGNMNNVFLFFLFFFCRCSCANYSMLIWKTGKHFVSHSVFSCGGSRNYSVHGRQWYEFWWTSKQWARV